MNLMDKFRLDGKVALVTGASRGIGRAAAMGFADAGAAGILCSRKLLDPEKAADASPYTTGAEIVIDGGMLLSGPAPAQ